MYPSMYPVYAGLVGVLASSLVGYWMWNETGPWERGYFVGWVLATIAASPLAIFMFNVGMRTWNTDQQWALPFMFVLPPVVAAAFVVWLKDQRDSKTVSAKCDWCGRSFVVTMYEWKAEIRSRRGIYCSGRCRRADEASRGVKERRVRFIDHE